MTATGDRQAGLDQIREGWSPRRVGRQIVWLAETPSTNSLALELASGAGDPDGLTVLADYQTAGRGRQGRQWLSPRGASALCSVVVIEAEMDRAGPTGEEQTAGHAVAGRLNRVAAVAACEAIAEATELRAAIKWPNDLRISGRKVGGILIESKALPPPQSPPRRAWVIGFGINCLQHVGHFPPELTTSAISLELAASHAVSRVAVIRALLMRLDRWLGASDWGSDPALDSAWGAMAEPIGQRIRLRYHGQEYAGRTLDVDPVGGLTVQLDNGRQMWFDPMLASVVP